jgi:hypothetical protein
VIKQYVTLHYASTTHLLHPRGVKATPPGICSTQKSGESAGPPEQGSDKIRNFLRRKPDHNLYMSFKNTHNTSSFPFHVISTTT